MVPYWEKKTDNIYLINAGKTSQSCLNIKRYLGGKVSRQ